MARKSKRHRAGGGPAGEPGQPSIGDPADVHRLQLRKRHPEVRAYGGRSRGRPDRRSRHMQHGGNIPPIDPADPNSIITARELPGTDAEANAMLAAARAERDRLRNRVIGWFGTAPPKWDRGGTARGKQQRMKG